MKFEQAVDGLAIEGRKQGSFHRQWGLQQGRGTGRTEMCVKGQHALPHVSASPHSTGHSSVENTESENMGKPGAECLSPRKATKHFKGTSERQG